MSMTSTELLPRPDTNTLPLPEAKWSKRPFTPSSGTDAVKIRGGGASAAGAALAGVAGDLLWHAKSIVASAITNASSLNRFIAVLHGKLPRGGAHELCFTPRKRKRRSGLRFVHQHPSWLASKRRGRNKQAIERRRQNRTWRSPARLESWPSARSGPDRAPQIRRPRLLQRTYICACARRQTKYRVAQACLP